MASLKVSKGSGTKSQNERTGLEQINRGIPLTEELLDQLVKKVKKRSGEPEMPTGLLDLDRLTWGLNDGELFVISARTKNGKTSLATQIAWNIAKRGQYVLFVSLEMSSMEILSRIISQEYEIDGFEAFRKGRMTPEISLKVESMREKLMGLNFHVVDNHGFDSEEIVELIESFRINPPFPRLIVVDHVQRARSRAGQSKLDAVSNYVNALKYLSQRYKCAVMACSQLNRTNNDPKWCVAPDTIVGGRKIIDHFKDGDGPSIVQSFDTDKFKSEFKMPSFVMNSGIQNCIKVKTRSGKELILSEDTKLYRKEGWTSAKDLKVGNKVLVEH